MNVELVERGSVRRALSGPSSEEETAAENSSDD